MRVYITNHGGSQYRDSTIDLWTMMGAIRLCMNVLCVVCMNVLCIVRNLIESAVSKPKELSPAVAPAVEHECVCTRQKNKPQEQIVDCNSPDLVPTAWEGY